MFHRLFDGLTSESSATQTYRDREKHASNLSFTIFGASLLKIVVIQITHSDQQFYGGIVYYLLCMLQNVLKQRTTILIRDNKNKKREIDSLLNECGLTVVEDQRPRIVFFVPPYQIPFLEHLEVEGLISLGSDDTDFHDVKEEVDDAKEQPDDIKEKAAVAGASALGELSDDRDDNTLGASKVSERETSGQTKKEAQGYDSSREIKRQFPVSVPGIKLKYVMKTDVGKLERKYKVTIKVYPSAQNPEGLEIIGLAASDLQNAEKRNQRNYHICG